MKKFSFWKLEFYDTYKIRVKDYIYYIIFMEKRPPTSENKMRLAMLMDKLL